MLNTNLQNIKPCSQQEENEKDLQESVKNAFSRFKENRVETNLLSILRVTTDEFREEGGKIVKYSTTIWKVELRGGKWFYSEGGGDLEQIVNRFALLLNWGDKKP